MLFFVNALFSFMYHLRKNFRWCIKRQNRLCRRSKKLFLQLRAIENDTCKMLQPSNASYPMLVTLSGNVMFVSSLQLLNAYAPTSVRS